MKNAALSRAIKWLFIAQLLSIVALLPLVYNLRSLLGAAAGLLTLAALVRAAREASGYRAALVLCVGNLVLGVLSSVLLRWFIYFLIRILGTWAVQIPYADAAGISGWAGDGVMWNVIAQYIPVREDGLFAPQGTLTGSEADAMIAALLAA